MAERISRAVAIPQETSPISINSPLIRSSFLALSSAKRISGSPGFSVISKLIGSNSDFPFSKMVPLSFRCKIVLSFNAIGSGPNSLKEPIIPPKTRKKNIIPTNPAINTAKKLGQNNFPNEILLPLLLFCSVMSIILNYNKLPIFNPLLTMFKRKEKRICSP